MITPCGNKVLVKPDVVGEKQGSLYVPDVARDRKMNQQIFGELVAVGEIAWKDQGDGKPQAKVGDKVAFAQYGGFLIEDPYTKEQFRLLYDVDIACVITEK
jgi:co-chaperonin GroES (HSP10)